MNKTFCADISLDSNEPLAYAGQNDFVVFFEKPIGSWSIAPAKDTIESWALDWIRSHTKGRPFRYHNFQSGNETKNNDSIRVFLFSKEQSYLATYHLKDKKIAEELISKNSKEYLFICTHGKRDKCCAKKGNAFYRSMAQRQDMEVFMASHTGGDRFAANALLLPKGDYFGRLDEKSADNFPFKGQENNLSIHYRGNIWESLNDQMIKRFLLSKGIVNQPYTFSTNENGLLVTLINQSKATKKINSCFDLVFKEKITENILPECSMSEFRKTKFRYLALK